MRHWNPSKYEHIWNSAGKKILSQKETAYIASAVMRYKPTSVLDIGCGTGRIIDAYILQPSIKKIYGIDTSEHMIAHCKKRFQNNKKVQDITNWDTEQQSPFSDTQFDMISVIRVLKYNNNWQQIIENITKRLTSNGILICTMPNIYSITALWPDAVRYTTPRKFQAALTHAGLRVIDMRGFSKLPDKLYTWTAKPALATLLHHTEVRLGTALGPTLGTRILFATCQKYE